MTVDLESEQFQTLLSDALRSGPGTPEWHQAVRTLRQQSENIKNDPAAGARSLVDDYTLLCTARERLESGKSYRSVRAGPGFTRKILDQVSDDDPAGRGRATSSGILLILAGLVIVAAIVAGAIVFFRGRGIPPSENLANVYFSMPAIPEARFDAPGPASTEPVIPPGWRQFGDLPLMTAGGLGPNFKAFSAASPPTTASLAASNDQIKHRIGGIVSTSPLPADQAFDVDLSFKILNNGKDFIVQAFVGDEPVSDQSAGSHEVVFQLAAAEGSVFLAGRAEPDACRLQVGKSVLVRILVDRQNVIVDADGQRLYSGPHQLGTNRPRYVGVRFLRVDKPQQNARDNGRLLLLSVRKP